VPDDSEAAAQVAAAEDQRYAAMLAGDTSALAQLLSDRLTYVHSSALLDTRQSLLAKISGRSIVYSAVDHPVRQIVVLCDAVLVTGEMHTAARPGSGCRAAARARRWTFARWRGITVVSGATARSPLGEGAWYRRLARMGTAHDL
jgi:hypothetical protein